MLRIAVYAVIALLVGAGLSIVYVAGTYELFVLPIVILARDVVMRAGAVIVDAIIRWGWNRFFVFIVLLALPTVWRRTLLKGLSRMSKPAGELWMRLRAKWHASHRYVRRMIESTAFFAICLAVAYTDDIVVLAALAFVRVPFLTPVLLWVRTVALRASVRIGVGLGATAVYRTLMSTNSGKMRSIKVGWEHRYRISRLAFVRRVMRGKKLAGQKIRLKQ